MKRPHKRSLAPKGDSRYRLIWRLANGAVADAFAMHPNYVETKWRKAARESIVKRVTGAIYSSLPERAGASVKNGG